MDASKKIFFVVIRIFVFDFELFIGGRCQLGVGYEHVMLANKS